MESYRTISGKSEASFTEKKSIFIANISFVDTEEAAQSFLGAVRKEHRTANHNVYAYRLQEGERTRYSDDGEPAKTAGLPVLEVLHHAELVNVIAVVTRYFGGT
ncbi:MAG: YigZ family protein, partial [Pygmaiobacter sp.]